MYGSDTVMTKQLPCVLIGLYAIHSVYSFSFLSIAYDHNIEHRVSKLHKLNHTFAKS